MTNPQRTDAEAASILINAYVNAQPRRTKILAPDPDFPLDVFPPAIAAWLEATAIATRVQDSMTATPFLALAGATIGNQLRLRVGPGWYERPALWIAVITLTGMGKTPAIAAARQPFDQLEQESRLAWRNRLAAWNASPEPRPPRPAMDRLFASGANLPGLTAALADSSGLVILRDELYGLFRGMDRHGGEDRQHYLTLWSSEPILPTRPESADVIPAPVVSIVGGLQPMLLRKIRRKDQDGLLERFLLVFAAGTQFLWDDSIPEPPDLETVLAILRPLRSIATARDTPHGATVTWSPQALRAWSDWLTGHIDQVSIASLVLSGFYHKLPSHLPRIALILHALWNPQDPTGPISGETMTRAIALTEYYRVHIHRSITLINERQRLRQPMAALGERILRILGETTENDGWLSRTNLLVALGRPETAGFSAIVEEIVKYNLIQARIVNAPGRGRPSTQYRIPK